ncbi:IclR family transcriptional regulator [Sporosarcina sp. BI001-red]|uniref:IclR family transcriptional regulator n=1 Tax=Sporosarcina sp. BI001-red TaxID=2282866 RepID=UPI000E2823C9|nr:IclR family transcriptional regulator [Sporosarcina sp. BI001-red]REB08624.1 IclR family transcriptional regulator [Sporosarcina sp. BI001-red]
MQTIDRVMQLAKILASESNPTGISISDIAKECDLALSTLHRILKSMVKQGLAEQDADTKLYKLGQVWMEYGLRAYDTMDYVSSIRPELDRLSREVEESIYLSKCTGLEAIIIERIDNENNQIRMYDKLGLRIPMNIGAANKIMLACMPTVESEKIIKQLVPEHEQEPFKKMLQGIEKQGYAISHGERTEGTSSIGVAVRNITGEVVGAISIGCVTFNLTEDRMQMMIEKILAAKDRVSEKIGRSS